MELHTQILYLLSFGETTACTSLSFHLGVVVWSLEELFEHINWQLNINEHINWHLNIYIYISVLITERMGGR